MIIVGDSSAWYRWEEENGYCHRCSGDGNLAITERAAYYPDKYREELKDCPDCNGTGKQG